MDRLLQVSNLSVSFRSHLGVLKAVRDVSFWLDKGETLGIVGESGSGKSVSCYSMMGLIPTPPGVIEGGKAEFSGIDLLHCSSKEMRSLRGKRISMIFQDPMSALNPYLTIGEQVAEPLIIHRHVSRKEAMAKAVEELSLVGIPDAEARMSSYPHEFSGGMRQRVMIAMALIARPEILIADEPTTALDVTVQKQVLDLIKKRQRELNIGVILITHDLGIVQEYADRINVMYAGSILESAPTDELLKRPRHAYTRSLIKSIPQGQAKGERLFSIPGLPPNLMNMKTGCSFRERNILGNPSLCLTDRDPELVECSPGHWVRNCPGCVEPEEGLSALRG